MWLKGLLAELAESLWKVCSPESAPCCLGESATDV